MSVSHTEQPDPVTVRLIPPSTDRRRNLEEEPVRAAFYDPQTELVSRALCLNRLEHALADTTRHKPGLAVVAMTPDGPSPDQGWPDGVLLSLACRMRAALRAADTPAHFGDGLYVIILTEISSALDAARVAQRLVDVAQTSIVDEIGMRRPITVSAGVALSRFCGGGPRASLLVKEACQALRGARSVKPAFVHVVTPHDHDEAHQLWVSA